MTEQRMVAWQRQTCGQCGCEFQYSRTEPKPIPTDPVFCGECAEYARGFEDGQQSGRDEWHRFRLQMRDARAAVGEGWFVGGVDLATAIRRKCSVLEIEAENARGESLYGAMVALHVRDYVRSGRGALDEEQMREFAEDARSVVELHDEATSTRCQCQWEEGDSPCPVHGEECA